MTGNQKRGADMNAFMSAAISEAREGIEKGHGVPFGCVIVKDGRIIGRGHNEVVARRDPTCHGEIMAIRDACGNLSSFDLQGCELYTTAEPCPMCFGAILWANIGKIFTGVIFLILRQPDSGTSCFMRLTGVWLRNWTEKNVWRFLRNTVKRKTESDTEDTNK